MANRAHRGGTFEQIVERKREQAPFRRRVELMARAADPLDRGRDALGRVDLADQLDRADVDTQLQRRGRDQRAQLTALKPLLGRDPLGARETPVMRQHGVVAETFLQVERDPLGPSAAQREDQGRTMLPNQRGDRVVHRLPVLMGRERAEVGPRRDHLEVHRTRAIVRPLGAHHFHRARAARAVGIGLGAGEKPGQPLDRIERRREPDSRRTRRAGRTHHPLQPLQREHQMRAALVGRERVQLIHDHVAHGAQTLTKARRGQQDEERLGRGDEDVGRPPEHRRALVGRSVAGAEPRAHFKYRFNFVGMPLGRGHTMRRLANSGQRLFEVDPDVVGERFQRRDVEHRDAVAEFAALGVAEKAVDRPHESGERLAAAGGRAQEHVMAGRRVASGDYRPSEGLRGRGITEALGEPGADGWMKSVEH